MQANMGCTSCCLRPTKETQMNSLKPSKSKKPEKPHAAPPSKMIHNDLIAGSIPSRLPPLEETLPQLTEESPRDLFINIVIDEDQCKSPHVTIDNQRVEISVDKSQSCGNIYLSYDDFGPVRRYSL